MEGGFTGSCLCSRIRFRISGNLFAAAFCHCSMCRKAHGSAFRPRALVMAEHFQWIEGKELLGDYLSSPGTHRMFCRHCGSPLIAYSEEHPDTINIALGSLDDDPGLKPAAHWHAASKASWYDITDGLPQYSGLPDSEPEGRR